MTKPILVVKGIEKSYLGRDGVLRALHDISFEVEAGEFVTLLGPSGCGKTTLLRILGGLLEPAAGKIYIEDHLLSKPRREVGFVFQAPSLLPWRTVLGNVTLPLEIQKQNGLSAKEKALELLELVGLLEFENAYPHELSVGMQQRVSIARALIHDPSILLMDEPFASLDAITREQMNLELLRIWEASQKTVVMVTHNIQEAIFLADRVLIMSPRPGHIEAIVPIALPRPRRPEMVYDDSFSGLFQTIHRLIG